MTETRILSPLPVASVDDLAAPGGDLHALITSLAAEVTYWRAQAIRELSMVFCELDDAAAGAKWRMLQRPEMRFKGLFAVLQDALDGDVETVMTEEQAAAGVDNSRKVAMALADGKSPAEAMRAAHKA